VIIDAPDHASGVAAEYEYVSQRYGHRGVDWQLSRQTLVKGTAEGRRYDVLTIRLKTGQTTDVHFDITSFFGKY
jgi:hypothetical protein